MSWIAKIAIALLLAATLSNVARGATVSVEKAQNRDDVTFVMVSGTFQLNDGDLFKSKTAQLSGHVVVFLVGDGGNLIAGLDIGRFIRMKGWGTAVSPNTTCASSCATAWLGGTRRFAWPNSRIGFHAAYYFDPSGRPIEKGVANAILGAYLNELGLSYAAVAYITSSAPDSMQWLQQAHAAKVGIVIEYFATETPVPQPAFPMATPAPQSPAPSKPQPPHERPGMTIEKAMKGMAVQVRGAWAQPSPDWNLLRRMYNDRVVFHEKEMSVDEVITSKKRFAEKWPLRTYSIRQDDTLTASCMSNVCDVKGVMDWRVRNPAQNKAESGVSTFEYRIRWTGEYYEVLAETTKAVAQDANFFGFAPPGPAKPFNPFNDMKPGGIR
jgi:hypothetical protein